MTLKIGYIIIGLLTLALIFNGLSALVTAAMPLNQQPVVAFAAPTYRVNEGGKITISVTINSATTAAMSVDYMTVAGQATAGQDYKTITGTLTFNAGDAAGTTKTFMVETLADKTGEGAESFQVTLANPVKAKLNTLNTAKVIINANGFPYLNPKLSTAARVKDLLGRMTINEKVGQMTQIHHQFLENTPTVITDFYLGSLLSGGGGAPRAGNKPLDWANMYDNYQRYALMTRLQIPLIYGLDAVHGNNNVYSSTIFPHNIGLGATRNPALVEKIGRVTAQEMTPTGINWTFSPCLCVSRDERWGRTYESFGEDPEIVSMMTTVIDGYQGTKLSNPDSVLATAKHFMGDGGTTGGVDRGNTEVDEATLRALHLHPFTTAITHHIGSIMPSFSSWNGVKMHGNKYLLQDVLKDELGFKGFLISDWEAIDLIADDFNYDVRVSINAGLDMVMVPQYHEKFITTLLQEINAGNIPMARIDDAVSRILTAKFELGLFERPFSDRTNLDKIGSVEHRAVAREAVRESLVLLKNDDKILPLPKTGQTILVAGKNADDLGHQMGGWSVTWQGVSGNNAAVGTTILQGIKEVAPGATVIFNETGTGTITANVGIVVVGETPYAEWEGDVKNEAGLSLTAEDKAVIDTVCQAIPCVVVLISGRPMLINEALAQAKAFVAAWLPGTEGAGVADVLFGNAPFTGQLSMTWPKSFEQLPINIGDTVYDPLFAYGYGLTYPFEKMIPTSGVNNLKLGVGGTTFTGTFTQAVTLHYIQHGPQNMGTWRHIGVFYNISAIDSVGKVITPTGQYTISVAYNAAALPSSINESKLALYYQDGLGQWVKEANSAVDINRHTMTAMTKHWGEWAILVTE